ncbi:tyrosine/serine protein phosphatase [Xylariaceae sp. FL0804]|nr:tyrosine/serine protein phosphatase [Xylariaceae sp. FL0804]
MSIAFENILNFRDVGKTVNDFLGRKTEHLRQAEKRRADLRTPALLQTNAALAEPVQIPGLQYREIRVTGRRFERYLVAQLTWWSYFKLIFLFVLGYRMRAIGVLTREVMLPRGLVGMGIVTLDNSGPEIAEALRVLAHPPAHPVLVHCTHGKDRTGLVVALALLVLGADDDVVVPPAAVAADYLLSRDGLRGGGEGRPGPRLTDELAEVGLTPDWADCPEDFVARTREHLDARYGGVVPYLDGIGFGEAERRAFVDALGA